MKQIILALSLLIFPIASIIITLITFPIQSSKEGVEDKIPKFLENVFLKSPQVSVKILKLNGVINNEEDSSSEFVLLQLEEELTTPSVDAIILLINSPGGTVTKTKKIYDLILELRKKRPLVCVIDDIAASGGYYIASACDRIYSQQSSIIGSIGVLSIRFNIQKLLEKLGIQTNVMKAGKFKDASYPFRSLLPTEVAMQQRLIDQSYKMFIEDVSKGRGVSIQKVSTWAEGKVFSGMDGLDLGMIDEIGGIREARKDLAKTLKSDDIYFIMPEIHRSFWNKLSSSIFYQKKREEQMRILYHTLSLPISYIYLDYFHLESYLQFSN